MRVALYLRVSTEDQAKEGYPHRFLSKSKYKDRFSRGAERIS